MESQNLLALSGSLRQKSYNTAALEALKVLALPDVKICIASISELPLFNPDRDGEVISTLNELKIALGASDGLVIASPEYAHGISGPLKNTLDWLVSGLEFPDIPIMLINTSPRSSHAHESLIEVLRTMSGYLVEKAFVSLPLLGSDMGADDIVAHPSMSAVLQAGLSEFTQETLRIKHGQKASGFRDQP